MKQDQQQSICQMGLAHKRRSTVSCASILANLSSSTNLTGVDLESVPSSLLLSIQSNSQFGLTLTSWHEGQVNFLGDELECSINLILSPSSNMTSDSSSIAKEVVKLVVT